MPVRKLPAATDYGNAIILAVSGNEEDLCRLRSTCEGSAWTLHTVRTIEEASEWLRCNPTPVVLCQEPLANGGWQGLLAFGAELPAPPNIVVFSRLADNRLWSEVLNCGGFDVLPFPADRKEFFRTISSAWRNWKDRSGQARTVPYRVLAIAG